MTKRKKTTTVPTPAMQPARADYLAADSYRIVPKVTVEKDYGFSLFKAFLLCIVGTSAGHFLWLWALCFAEVGYGFAIGASLAASVVLVVCGIVNRWLDPLEEEMITWKAVPESAADQNNR